MTSILYSMFQLCAFSYDDEVIFSSSSDSLDDLIELVSDEPSLEASILKQVVSLFNYGASVVSLEGDHAFYFFQRRLS